MYFGSENNRLTTEWVQVLGEHTPAEILIGGRFQRGRVVVQPAVGVGINNQPGTPKLRGLVSFSYRKPSHTPPHIAVETPPAPDAQVIALPDSVFSNLKQVGQMLASQDERMGVRIEIHTTSDGDEAEQRQRVEALTTAVSEYLQGQGLSEDRIQVAPRAGTGSEWIDIIMVQIEG